MHDLLKFSLCNLQGEFFELSAENGFDSVKFINTFMRSRCAADLDMEFNRLQWLGEAYLMEEFIDEAGDKLVPGKQYPKGALFWTGYIYRYWHFLTGESSKEISKQIKAKDMLCGPPCIQTTAGLIYINDLKEDMKKIIEDMVGAGTERAERLIKENLR